MLIGHLQRKNLPGLLKAPTDLTIIALPDSTMNGFSVDGFTLGTVMTMLFDGM